MLRIEDKLLIECIKNDDISNVSLLKKSAIDWDYVLEQLLNHRIFLLLYEKLKYFFPSKTKAKATIYYYEYLKDKEEYEVFLNELLKTLNENQIDYILLKGIVNEHKIYKKKQTRMYSDIDLFIHQNDFERCIVLLMEKYGYNYYGQLSDYNQHEVRLAIQYNNKEQLVEIKKRHRECSYLENNIFFENKSIIDINQSNVNTLNYEALLISSCLYLYNYIERVDGIINSTKIRLCYFADLFYLIKKNIINYDKIIGISLKHKFIHKIVLILHHLSDLFYDDEIYNIYKLFEREYKKYDHNDYFDIGRIRWNFSIQDRIFNNKDVAKIISNYMLDKFYINQTYMTNYLNAKKNLKEKDEIKLTYKIENENNYLKFKFENLSFPLDGNFVIYIMLYVKNKYGEYIAPFIPISIRLLKDSVKCYSRFTVNQATTLYNYLAEKEMPYQKGLLKYNFSDNYLEVYFDLSKYDINIINGYISYNISFIKLVNRKNVFVIDRVVDVCDNPVLLIYGSKNYLHTINLPESKISK